MLGIVQTLAEHLIAAADADDRAAVGGGPRDRRVQPALAQPREIGHGRLAAGKNDDVRAIDRLGVCDEAHGHARLGGQRLEIVEVRDARQSEHGHAQPRVGDLARDALEPQRVLVRQRRLAEMRHDAEHGHARARREEIEPGGEHARIAAEAIDDEPRDAHAVVGGEQGQRADEGGEDAAAIDVAHQHHGRARESRHAHVGEIELEVDLRGAAGALDDDEIVRAAQPLEALDDHGPERRRQASIAAPVEAGDGAAAHDDLRALVGLRLQQDRIHVDRGLDTGGGRLHGLRPADLAAVRGHGGVERHVL